MNRVTALLLAMATLLAHALAIHLTEAGEFAPPYEAAHRAFHLARVWVREGVLAWNPGAPAAMNGGLEAYPSPVWIGVSAIAERLYLPVSLFTQIVGIVCALLTVAMSARFDTNRLAGVIPALLLVTSGAFAAAGPSGTEIPLVALLCTIVLVAYQLHAPLALSLALGLLVATRPEGVGIALAVLALSLADRARRRSGRARRSTVPPWWSFVPAALVTAALFAARDGQGGSFYGGVLGEIVRNAPDRSGEGLAYLVDFAITTITPALLVIPVLALGFRKLSGTGARALVLGLAWCALIVARGGGLTVFTIDLVPALPLFGIAIQQGLVATLDSRVRMLERLAWALLLPACLIGALASKFPGNLGPTRLVELHSRWLETSVATPTFGAARLRGRPSLGDEIRRTSRLRDLGCFLRDNVDPEFAILTPWPGAIGYLSGMKVYDLFGRTTPPVGAKLDQRVAPRPQIDLAAQLERGVDFVLPGLISHRDVLAGGAGIDPRILEFDPFFAARGGAQRMQAAFAAYELVCLPVVREKARSRANPSPLYALRRKSLGLAPTLEVSVAEGVLQIDMLPATDRPVGHPQLGRLEVALETAEGGPWYLDPRGRAIENGRVNARAELRLELGPEGQRIRLLRMSLPELPSGPPVRVRASLSNPVIRRGHPLAAIGEPVELELR